VTPFSPFQTPSPSIPLYFDYHLQNCVTLTVPSPRMKTPPDLPQSTMHNRISEANHRPMIKISSLQNNTDSTCYANIEQKLDYCQCSFHVAVFFSQHKFFSRKTSDRFGTIYHRVRDKTAFFGFEKKNLRIVDLRNTSVTALRERLFCIHYVELFTALYELAMCEAEAALIRNKNFSLR